MNLTDLETRFWNRVNRTKDGCWNWKGEVQPNGYGRIQLNGKRMSAHRLAWVVQAGSIPEKHLIHHKCENRQCVRIDHLQALSPSDHTRAHENARYGY